MERCLRLERVMEGDRILSVLKECSEGYERVYEDVKVPAPKLMLHCVISTRPLSLSSELPFPRTGQ